MRVLDQCGCVFVHLIIPQNDLAGDRKCWPTITVVTWAFLDHILFGVRGWRLNTDKIPHKIVFM